MCAPRPRHVVVIAAMVGTMACQFDLSGFVGEETDPGSAVPDEESAPDAAPACEDHCVDTSHLASCSEGKVVACEHGCDMDAPRCRALVPSNGARHEDLEDVTEPLVIPQGVEAILDTDTGEIRTPFEILREAGEGVNDGIRYSRRMRDVGLLGLEGLHVHEGAVLRVVGGAALLVLARGAVTVEGVIDLSAGCQGSDSSVCPGPGGGFGASADGPAFGCGAGGDGVVDPSGPESGGGGGGRGDRGARGGHASLANQGGEAGPVGGCPSIEEDLVGGSGGGMGGGSDDGRLEGGRGGGGGGALQISSYTRIELDRSSRRPIGIRASGAGGEGGAVGRGGGGGGSGGAILLEAPDVVLVGATLAANGGGGGAGGSSVAGDAGLFGPDPADGGVGFLGYDGGRGGAKRDPAEAGVGANLPKNADGTGGGGGGVGVIQIRALPGRLVEEEAVVSPLPTYGAAVIQ